MQQKKNKKHFTVNLIVLTSLMISMILTIQVMRMYQNQVIYIKVINIIIKNYLYLIQTFIL
ncbi:hypothetical protein C1645_766938, partial [Glomus cerebriforme]